MKTLRTLTAILAEPFMQATRKEKVVSIIAALGLIIICIIASK